MPDRLPGCQRRTSPRSLGLTFPVVTQNTAVTPTYSVIEVVYDGGNPYPFYIINDRNGIMRYISREYDPAAMKR